MTGTVQTVASWGDAIFVALTGALNDALGFVPKLLGALVILSAAEQAGRLADAARRAAAAAPSGNGASRPPAPVAPAYAGAAAPERRGA